MAFLTNWGLLRHRWVVAKLAINLVATVILLTCIPSLSGFADAATRTAGNGTVNQIVNLSPVVHSGIAVLLAGEPVKADTAGSSGPGFPGWMTLTGPEMTAIDNK